MFGQDWGNTTGDAQYSHGKVKRCRFRNCKADTLCGEVTARLPVSIIVMFYLGQPGPETPGPCCDRGIGITMPGVKILSVAISLYLDTTRLDCHRGHETWVNSATMRRMMRAVKMKHDPEAFQTRLGSATDAACGV